MELDKLRKKRRRARGFNNKVYWLKELVSATVEEPVDSDIVVTFSNTVKPFSLWTKDDFSIINSTPERTITAMTVDEATKTVTFLVNIPYTHGCSCTLVHSPEVGEEISTVVTINIAQ